MISPYWASVLGPAAETPDHVTHGGYVLCRGCSRGQHQNHAGTCACDICETEEP